MYIPPYFRKIFKLTYGYLGNEFIGLGHDLEVPNLIHYTIGPWGFWDKISMTSYTRWFLIKKNNFHDILLEKNNRSSFIHHHIDFIAKLKKYTYPKTRRLLVKSIVISYLHQMVKCIIISYLQQMTIWDVPVTTLIVNAVKVNKASATKIKNCQLTWKKIKMKNKERGPWLCFDQTLLLICVFPAWQHTSFLGARI